MAKTSIEWTQESWNPIEQTGLSPETVTRLRELTDKVAGMSHEDLDRMLTVLEQKMSTALMIATPEDELVNLREQAAREVTAYKGKMQGV
jgi:hypothetical protein